MSDVTGSRKDTHRTELQAGFQNAVGSAILIAQCAFQPSVSG